MRRVCAIAAAITLTLVVATWASADLSTRVEQALAAMFNAAGRLVRLEITQTTGPFTVSKPGQCVIMGDTACDCVRFSCDGQPFGVVVMITPTPTATATATATPTRTPTPTPTPT